MMGLSAPAPLRVERFVARYRNPQRRARILPLYEAMLGEGQRLARPAWMRREVAVSEVAAWQPWLPPATARVVLGLCSLGPALDERVRELFDEAPDAAVVLDEVGVAMVGALAREVHTQVRAEARERGLRAGPPYRPGVGRWPLRAQRRLFELLPGERIGVTFEEHLMMWPTKSISLIMPLLDAAPE